jgi:hypothetical protein
MPLRSADEEDSISAEESHSYDVPPTPPLPSLTPPPQRYWFYVERFLDTDDIAPFKSDWVQRILALIDPSKLPRVAEEVRDAIAAEILGDAEAQYFSAVKRAIVDYLLQNPSERDRLGIPFVPPTFDEQYPVAYGGGGVMTFF